MKVLLTGREGQLGTALQASLPEGVILIATGRSELDLADHAACRQAVRDHRPDWVLNAGAYTAVDRAESEADRAMAINAGAPQAFAEALRDTGGRLLQVSTDFVFNGAQGSPYRRSIHWGSTGPPKRRAKQPPWPFQEPGCCAPAGCMGQWAKTSASRCCGSMP
jgi:dTDP-4-dehydrorhamnose reductase